MWPYLTDHPSSKYYDDDDDSGGGESPWDWKFCLGSPLIVLLMLLVGIAPFLALVLYFLHDVYTTLRRTVDTGRLSYPFLTKAGSVVAMILGVLLAHSFPNAPIHPSVWLVLAIGFVLIFTALPLLALCLHQILKIRSFLSARIGRIGSNLLSCGLLGLCLTATVLGLGYSRSFAPTSLPANKAPGPGAFSTATPAPTSLVPLAPQRSVTILLDDFIPQPYQGDAVYSYNRVEGDRGALNNSSVSWGHGEVDATISEGNTWGGLWMSLNHPIREGKSINFSAVLPPQILPSYQSRITGIVISVADGTPSRIFRVELKDSRNILRWAYEIALIGHQQTMKIDLPPLGDISQVVLVLDRGAAGDFVVITKIALTATTPVTDTATAAFVWSYGMLLNNWEPLTGLVRDKAKDASGEFDAIQATGSLAAATALAEQLGVIDRAHAVDIVNKISDTLLNRLPRSHGLWPHWVRMARDGEIEIVPNTEWSSVDTVIAAIGLLDAQQSLGLNTGATEQMLREIQWNDLLSAKGISHGYTYDDKIIPYAWDVFGGESWLVELAYSAATGSIAPLAYPSAPTANGSGFIDELAWLFIMPPARLDYWGTDWNSYRTAAVEKQVSYFAAGDALSCLARLGLFGLSAAEVPAPAQVPKDNIYQAFGMGGQFAPVNDGVALLGSAAVAPHYSAMVASLRPQAAIKMWDWLMANGYFTPLNNVESLTFHSDPSCSSTSVQWNQLKGSWNLALQALGWGRYLVERAGFVPAVWQATVADPFLNKGYRLLAPDEAPKASQTSESLWALLNDANPSCEDRTDYTMGLPGIYRYSVVGTHGEVRYASVEQTSARQHINYAFALGWPPGELSAPPSTASTTKTGMETIITRFGVFQALRVDIFQEYRLQTMNHSDPSGTIRGTEWYVCGIGLIRASIDHRGEYQSQPFDRQSELELVSFTSLP